MSNSPSHWIRPQTVSWSQGLTDGWRSLGEECRWGIKSLLNLTQSYWDKGIRGQREGGGSDSARPDWGNSDDVGARSRRVGGWEPCWEHIYLVRVHGFQGLAKGNSTDRTWELSHVKQAWFLQFGWGENPDKKRTIQRLFSLHWGTLGQDVW